MTLDEMEAAHKPLADLPPGCQRHDAYWDWRCRKGTLGCGIYHKDVPEPKLEERQRKYEGARKKIRDREVMALEGKCASCAGTMRELESVLRLPGIRYFVCSLNKAHTVCIIPEDIDKV